MCVGELHCARFTLTQDSREKYSGRRTVFILKPSTMQNILLTTVILASLAAVGDSLSCYICRSDRKPECAKTLDVEERSKADYISECDESQAPVGCKKIITNEYNYELIIRDCSYNHSAAEHLPVGCEEYMHTSVCRCIGDGCNGQAGLVSNTMLMLVTVIAARLLLCSSNGH
ncbi:UPAR/Ly6 domain-containing protein CG9338-like isoform X1 [Argopecten irradians]|uniref:UPAR/Ly6 domain-containing protein CG9338-like isoform X1 n=1 Tax=Argopecten irradians TaxID=31199 RepID=UPI0037136E6C